MKKIVAFLDYIIMCCLLYRVRYSGLENIKKMDKCIICPNHSSIYDPAWIYPKVSNFHVMAKSELFKNKFIAGILKYFGAFPIKRGKKDAGSLMHAIDVLINNKKSKLLIFPEGGILKEDRRRIYITNGPTYIAAKANVPIIPVFITENPKRFSKIYVRFGKPMQISSNVLENKEILNEKSKELLNKIYALEGNGGN